MKPRILFLIDHVYPEEALSQKCQIHDKDWLSKQFNILYIVRTLNPTHIKYRANFRIKAFNYQESYLIILDEIKNFKPDIVHIYGPLILGDANKFVLNLHDDCTIIQQYAGSAPCYYGSNEIDYVIIDKVHELVFQHIPKEKLILRNNCCDLDFFKPMDIPKQFDCIMGAGFYCFKGQDIVYECLKNDPISILFLGTHKSNMGIETNEFTQMKLLINPINKAKVIFEDNVEPKEMPKFYNQSKIFVWGSKTSIENPITITNRSVTEAAACGLPFVGFRETFQHSNFIIDRVNAFLVNNEEEFGRAVCTLLLDDDLRIKMGNESRRLAVQELDFNKWHNELLSNLYNKIMSEKENGNG